MKKVVKVNCLECGQEFEALEAEIKRGYGKFHNKECFYSYSKKNRKDSLIKEPNCICAFCSNPIYKAPSKIKNSKSGLLFCNRKCKELAQKQKIGFESILPPHYHTASIINYRNKAFENLPLVCNKCGYNKYPQVLQIHHIDRNRKNNDINNLLVVCPTCHMEIHYETKTGYWINSSI